MPDADSYRVPSGDGARVGVAPGTIRSAACSGPSSGRTRRRSPLGLPFAVRPLSVIPSVGKIRDILLRAFEALADVHAAGVVHRALTPDRVYITPDNKIVFGDFGISRLDGRQTIADVGGELLPEDYYRAPECRVDLAFAVPASDVYGLAASLSYWATGTEPDESSNPLPDVAPIGWSDTFFKLWSDTISRCLLADERARPTSRQVLDLILAARKSDEESATMPSHGLKPGELVDGRYRIVRELGAGATATTYLADDLVADMRVVLKRIRQTELVKRLGLREFQTLRKLRHTTLDRGSERQPGGRKDRVPPTGSEAIE